MFFPGGNWVSKRYFSKAGVTLEGGNYVKLTNRTGSVSVKGSIVSVSDMFDDSFMLQKNQYDAIAVVYEDGVEDGEDCWVITGGRAEILLEDGTSATRGNWVHSGVTDGRANASLSQPSGGGFTNANEHFKEIGHCLESKNAGVNVLVKAIIHFN